MAESSTGSLVTVAADEMSLRRTRAQECEEAVQAIRDQRVCDPAAVIHPFPSPLWIASTPLVKRLSPAIITPVHIFSIPQSPDVDAQALRGMLQTSLPSVLGDVKINSLFHSHLMEKDAAGAYKRFDVDHYEYLRLIPATLASPLEVYAAKSAGRRVRFVYLSFYLIDAAWTYHVAIVTRDLTLLTAYRMNGGRAKFLSARNGILKYSRYEELLIIPTPTASQAPAQITTT